MATLLVEKTIFTISLGFLCLPYIFLFLILREKHQWLPKHVTNNTVFQLPRAASENLLINKNITVLNATASRKSEQAHPRPSLLKKPLTPPSKTGCFPYFRELHVQPVPQHDCDQPYVTINYKGRLGNRMCHYTFLYLLRHLFGVRVSILQPMYKTLNKVFKNLDIPLKDPNCFVGTPKVIVYQHMYDKMYMAAARAWTNSTSNFITDSLITTSYHVSNYPAPRDLFLEHRKLIHSLFKFRDEVMENALQNINNALQRFNATYHQRDFPIVTVHVRRTDYERHMKKLYNVYPLGTLYYTNAFEFYKKRLKRPVFLVVSDDPRWCRKNLQAKDVLVIASKVPAVDMAAMSLGDHHVTSYGTFSFMGALLGSGNITHPLTTNPRYRSVRCVKSPIFHHVPRGEKQGYDKQR